MMDQGAAPAARGQRKPEIDWRVLLFLFAAGTFLTLAHRLDADEGQILTGAWNLFNGQRIYHDFFEFIGPGSFAWVSVFFRALGPSYGTAVFASQVLLLVSLWAFHTSAHLIIAHRGAAVAASVLWLLAATTPPFINHNTYSSFLATVFALFLLRFLGDGGYRHVLLAGGVGTLTFFFLQPKGIALLGVGLLIFIVHAWRGTGARGDGMQTPLRSTEARSAGQPLLWGNLLRIVGTYMLGATAVALVGFLLWGVNPVSALVTVGHGTLAMNHLSISYLPLMASLGVAAMVTWASLREGLLDDVGKSLLLLQCGLWASSAHLPDGWHLWINSFPLLLMIGRLGGRSLSRTASPGWRHGIVFLFIVVVLAGAGRSVLQNICETRVSRVWIAELENLLGAEDFFVFTFLPSFYLELGVQNPYYNSVLYVGNHPPDHFERNVAILSERKPRFVILDYASVEKYGHTLDNPVDDFIRLHYERIWFMPHSRGTVEIWERLGAG